jgi:hypothetical protein
MKKDDDVVVVVEDDDVEEDVEEDIVVEVVEEEEDEAEEEERENPTVLRHRQFHHEIFRLYDPSLFDLCARPDSSKDCWRRGKPSACIDIHDNLPCYIERYSKPRRRAHPVEEQVVVPLLETLEHLECTRTRLSESTSLYLCMRPKACRKT